MKDLCCGSPEPMSGSPQIRHAYIQTVQTTWISPFRFGVSWMVLLVVSTSSVFTKFYGWLGQLIANSHQRPWEIISLVTSKGQTRDSKHKLWLLDYLGRGARRWWKSDWQLKTREYIIGYKKRKVWKVYL